MTWEHYYDNFYDWAPSTQLSNLSKLTDFGALDEICEIAENFMAEKDTRAFLKKALRQGVAFDAPHILQLAETVDTETIKALLASFEGSFTLEQRAELEDLTMLSADEFSALCAEPISFSGLSWQMYYDRFDDLSDTDKTYRMMQLQSFGPPEEIIELSYTLVNLHLLDQFIRTALEQGVVFSNEQVEELLCLGDKILNARLVFRFFDFFADENYQILANYLFPADFKKFETMVQEKFGWSPPPKLGFFDKLSIALLEVHIFNHVWDFLFGKKGNE